MPREDTQFKKGQSGNPAGRPKGSPNRVKKILDVAAICDELNFCPVRTLVKLSVDAQEKGDTQLALNATKEVLPYVAAKHKALEIDLTDSVEKLLVRLNMTAQQANEITEGESSENS